MMRKWVFTATNIKFQQRIILLELDGTLAMGCFVIEFISVPTCVGG